MDKKIVDKLINAGLISYTNIDADKYNDVKELLANGIISTPIELDKLYMLVGETNTEIEIETESKKEDTEVKDTKSKIDIETKSKVEETEVKNKEHEIEVETESKVEDTEVKETEHEIEVEDIQVVVDKVKESTKPSKRRNNSYRFRY